MGHPVMSADVLFHFGNYFGWCLLALAMVHSIVASRRLVGVIQNHMVPPFHIHSTTTMLLLIVTYTAQPPPPLAAFSLDILTLEASHGGGWN